MLARLALLACFVVATQAHAQPPVVARDEPTVGPAYPREFIRRVVRRHRAELQRCVPAGSTYVPTALSFTIGPDGHVTQAGVELTGPGGEAVARCIEGVLLAWVFPTPPGGAPITVRYPLR